MKDLFNFSKRVNVLHIFRCNSYRGQRDNTKNNKGTVKYCRS